MFDGADGVNFVQGVGRIVSFYKVFEFNIEAIFVFYRALLLSGERISGRLIHFLHHASTATSDVQNFLSWLRGYKVQKIIGFVFLGFFQGICGA